MGNIRHMQSGDIWRVYEIERRTFPFPFGETLIGNIYFSSPELCFVIENDELVGFLLGGRTSDPKEAHIMSFAVKEEHRRKGLGNELIVHFINATKKMGYKRIRLEVQIDNQSAINLYEKHGFVQKERIRKYYEDNTDAFVYKLKLD